MHHKWKEKSWTSYAKQPMSNHRGPPPDEKSPTNGLKDNSILLPISHYGLWTSYIWIFVSFCHFLLAFNVRREVLPNQKVVCLPKTLIAFQGIYQWRVVVISKDLALHELLGFLEDCGWRVLPHRYQIPDSKENEASRYETETPNASIRNFICFWNMSWLDSILCNISLYKSQQLYKVKFYLVCTIETISMLPTSNRKWNTVVICNNIVNIQLTRGTLSLRNINNNANIQHNWK